MATRRQVVWSRTARRTLDEILDHIAQDSPAAAGEMLATALDRASSLDRLSSRGRQVPEVGSPSVREIFLHRYRMLYEIRDHEVVILAVIHGARDFEEWRKRN